MFASINGLKAQPDRRPWNRLRRSLMAIWQWGLLALFCVWARLSLGVWLPDAALYRRLQGRHQSVQRWICRLLATPRPFFYGHDRRHRGDRQT